MKTKPWRWLFMVPLLAIFGGCIVQDQLMTLTLHPDGSADLIVFRSNIRSTEAGDKAKAEIAAYRAAFDAHTQDGLRRIIESGARIEMASWVRQQAPLANVVHARIPDAAALEQLATVKDDDGSTTINPTFTRSNTSRRLSFQVALEPNQSPPVTGGVDEVKRIKRERASGISDLRIALSAGTITDARGFTVASDGQSAVLDEAEVDSLLRAGEGKVELFLQWDVSN